MFQVFTIQGLHSKTPGGVGGGILEAGIRSLGCVANISAPQGDQSQLRIHESLSLKKKKKKRIRLEGNIQNVEQLSLK